MKKLPQGAIYIPHREQLTNNPFDDTCGCSFFAYNWKLPAYSGAFLLTVDYFSFFTCNWSFFAYSFLLCLLSRIVLVNIFFFVFAWEFCIDKWRGFLVNFFWSPFPTKRSTETPQKFRGKFGAKFGAKFGTRTRRIRGTFVLRLF